MYDVLIIGSGAAGLTAALNAKNPNTKVLLVSKTYPTHSQTVQAQGGINAVLYEGTDSIEQHVLDTYGASKGLADKENIKFMCENAKETIQWLDKIGVPFNRDDKDLISQRKFGGTKNIRTCYSSDYTGLKIVHTLYDQCIKNDIEIISEHFLLDLIVEENNCHGGIFYDIVNGDIKEINSKTTILATGGYSGIYNTNTTNSYSNSADGLSVALRAGAKLSNMEFVQFHPTALLNTNILISESARGEGGYLVDHKEERFIDELEARDVVARSIFSRNKESNQVYLDLRHLGLSKINELMPQERKLALEFSNIKLEEELLPINPAAHYSMGGILTNINSETSIRNLYACGECAQANIHGANRLGGNSLLEIVTFGKVAGKNASLKSKSLDYENKRFNSLEVNKDLISQLIKRENEIDFYSKKDELGKLLFKDVGLYRDESKLNEVLSLLEQLEFNFNKMGINDKSSIYNKNLVELLEFKNMIEISKLVVKCSLLRKESRGSHYRSDYPDTNKEYEKNTIIKKSNKEIEIYFEDIK